MGNILCKNRTNKTATRTKSPVDRVIRNLQICPQGIGKKKYFWEKHILETSPANSQMPKDDKDGWQNAALTVPNNDQNSKELDRPVAPPRKKRSSKLHKDEPIKNGFEDVFLGDKDNLKSKSLSNINTNNNYIHINKPSSPTTNSLSKLNTNSNDMIETNNKTTATTLPRKISKVGNKKSDKFFGENLSDCLSDEILPTTDKTTLFEKISVSDNHVIKSSGNNNEDKTDNVLEIVNLNHENETVTDVGIEDEELLRKINKEKGKLMFSIEKQIDKTEEDEERYKGEVPVEEEIIVPVKKIYKHICDDDHDLRMCLHLHNNIDNISTNSSGPKKPQRDLAKYKNSLNKKDIKESSQKENQSSTELNKNQMKCDHGTQTGKRVIDNEDHKNKTEIMDNITQQAKLAINDILKSAEAAVEHQINNEANERINKDERGTKSVEKKENNVDSIILSDELIIHNNEDNHQNTIKSPQTSDTNFNLVSTESISPEIKIDYNTISNNISPERNESPKTEDQLENELSKSQPSPRPVRTSEIIPPNLSNSEKIFRRCLSTQSYLTSDLIEKIALQANILSLPGGFSPEDALQCNDGSGLVSPNFKLDQKRSLSPQISTIGDKIDIEKPIPKIESTENVNIITNTEKSSSDTILKLQEKNDNNDTNLIEKNIDIKPKIINNNTNGSTALKHPQSKIEKRIIRTPNRQLSKDNSCTVDNESKRDVSEAIKSFLNKKDLRPQEISELLQDEFGDCIFPQCLPPEDKLIIEDLQKSIKESKIEKSLTPTETKQSFKFTEKKHIKSPEKHKISKIPVLTNNKSLENLNFNDKRRHSIDDLNAWFSPEKDFPLRKRKREASLPGSLDNAELFNGKINHGHFPIKSILIEQENEENIEKSANKLVDDILSKAENNINSKENKQTIAQEEEIHLDVKDNGGNSGKSHKDINGNSKDFHIERKSDSTDEDDHSALLKFLEHEKLNNL